MIKRDNSHAFYVSGLNTELNWSTSYKNLILLFGCINNIVCTKLHFYSPCSSLISHFWPIHLNNWLIRVIRSLIRLHCFCVHINFILFFYDFVFRKQAKLCWLWREWLYCLNQRLLQAWALWMVRKKSNIKEKSMCFMNQCKTPYRRMSPK